MNRRAVYAQCNKLCAGGHLRDEEPSDVVSGLIRQSLDILVDITSVVGITVIETVIGRYTTAAMRRAATTSAPCVVSGR
jgi:hypothetical protein